MQTPRKRYVDDWFDLVAVDPDVYLFYMLYRVNQTLGDKSAMQMSLLYMNMVMQTNVKLSHLDTAYNLMGCMLKGRGEPRAAWECFRTSWTIRRDHNAAKWHIAMMVSEAVEALNTRKTRASEVELIYSRK